MFLEEFMSDATTLPLERAREIARVTEKYLLELLEQINK